MIHVLLSDVRITTTGPCADEKPAGQNSRDQPNLEETGTDFGLLIALNRLPKARVGHQLTSGMDPDRRRQ